MRSNGFADYSILDAVLVDIGLSPYGDLNISNWDDYKLRLYKIEAIYRTTDALTGICL